VTVGTFPTGRALSLIIAATAFGRGIAVVGPAPRLALEHLTRPAPGDGPHPGLLLLHGIGADEYDLMGIAPALDRRLFVVSARAPFEYDYGGFTWYGLHITGTYDRPVFRVDQPTLLQSRAMLAHFLDEMLATYPIDATRLYLLGFSQGAGMAAHLTLTEPRRVAGTILMSGAFQPEPELKVDEDGLAGKPVLMIHGTHDPMIPIERAHTARDFFEATPADFTYTEYPMAHEIALPALRQVAAWLEARLDGGE
jgi:phospholipase/carboxylesterase